MNRRVPVMLVAVLLSLALAAPAAAHPLVHPAGPRVVNPRPAPGDIVAAGAVGIAALVGADREIVAHRLSVDGREIAATRGTGTHPTVAATVDLGPGEHIAEVVATDSAGRTTARAWRFTVSGLDVQRLRGQGRVETAAAVSRDLYPRTQSAAAAVIARADDFADALAGVPLAQAVNGPLLLSGRDELAAATGTELSRALAPGATVYLLGGAGALGPSIEAQVAALGFVPERLAGSSRYATAVAVAERLPPATTAFVVSGVAFPDALAASSPAAARGWPVLLTLPDALPSETRERLVATGVERVFVVGGRGSVSEAVADELRALVLHVERLAGPGRYDTAEVVARRFFSEVAVAAVASGETFPDALAGSRHAAAEGVPLLLAAPDRLLAPQARLVAEHRPGRAVVYGGPAAVGERAVGDLRRSHGDVGGAELRRATPAEGATVSTLDQVVLEFERDLQVQHSPVYVSIGGHEVAGRTAIGDFPNTLVFSADELPGNAGPGAAHEVRVTAAAYDGARWRHVDHRFIYRKLDLSRGDAGPAVRDLQQRLAAAGYWLGAADGVYGMLTHQAVMALQKVHGLPRTGVYDAATRRLLEGSLARPRPRSTTGRWLEMDLDRQVVYAVLDGQVQWVFNASSGHGRWYEFNGFMYRATTTTGRRRVTRQIDGMREAERGKLWRPKYFDDARGIAIHGSTSVPAQPASSGCVRVTYPAMDFIWDAGLAPLGTNIWVYPEAYYG